MQMIRLPRGKNIMEAGWEDGILAVRFKASGEYRYHAVPEEKFASLKRVPFPDGYFTRAIKGKFTCTKVEDSNGSSHVQDATGRVRDSSHVGSDSQRRIPHVHDTEHGRAGGGLLQNGGRDAGGQIVTDRESYYTTANRELDTAAANAIATDNRKDTRNARREVERERYKTMEIFRPEDGMAFVETDPQTGQPCHYYTLKGQRVPFSLTQILELSGIARQPESASEIAARPAKAKLGTKVHEYTLWADQGELDLDDLKPYLAYYNRVLGWQQFREDFHFEPDLTSCEIPIGVRINGMLYAMKVDAYGVIGEGDNLAMAVVEKKCSCDLEASYQIQTAGQALAFKSHADSVQMPLKRFVVQLLDRPNQANRLYRCVQHEDRMDEKIFLGAGLMNVYWRLNNKLLKG